MLRLRAMPLLLAIRYTLTLLPPIAFATDAIFLLLMPSLILSPPLPDACFRLMLAFSHDTLLIFYGCRCC